MQSQVEKSFNGAYRGRYLDRVAFPLGGIGAGMLCLEGTGALSHVSMHGVPQVLNEPLMFAAICLRGEANTARVLAGPVPRWKAYFPWGGGHLGSGSGGRKKDWGLPRFANASFLARIPFGAVRLVDPNLPISVRIVGWSPLTPPDSDDSSLPVAALEYRVTNRSDQALKMMFSFHASQFMLRGESGSAIEMERDGFVLRQEGVEQPCDEGAFRVAVDADEVAVDAAWFRAGQFDTLTVVWNNINRAQMIHAEPIPGDRPGPGASLYTPLDLAPGESRTVRVRLSWYVPLTDLRSGTSSELPGHFTEACPDTPPHVPWYAGRFADVAAVDRAWRERYDDLRSRSLQFMRCFYDTSLPGEVVEAVAANIMILKTPTVLRQTDGRLWAWEGCKDEVGCCPGSCTHVWNYAQALPHLFPHLERTLRTTEFGEDQNDEGHQQFRASLPIRPTPHNFHAAVDGQLGGVMKVYRDWRISGDIEWLRSLWPRVKQSLDYCIRTWDPDGQGAITEPHHNTYDIEFWGPDSMACSFYLGALRAGAKIAKALGDAEGLYEELYWRGRALMEDELFNGEFFIQQVRCDDLHAARPEDQTGPGSRVYTMPEARDMLLREGPFYQYGQGCLSDGVLGAWMAEVCGIGEILDPDKVRSHLLAVHRYNFKPDLSQHANAQRPTYALGNEGGLLLCTWPRGGRPTVPFIYSDEVWTGIEHQVASHLMSMGCTEQGLQIVRACRQRYDGSYRNPFDEYECGHWYARAMSSYALLWGMTGARYDAMDRSLAIAPRPDGSFRAFLSTAVGFGTLTVSDDGRAAFQTRGGSLQVDRVIFNSTNIK